MENDKDQILNMLQDYYSMVFDEELLNEIAAIGVYRKYDKGRTMIEIGDELSEIPLILDGAVKIIREDSKKDEILMYFLERGDTCAISFVNCINKNKSIFRGEVEKDTECIMIPVQKIEEWLIKYRSWRQFIVDSYHNRMLEMVEAIDSLAFMNLDDRLYKYLTDKVKIMRNFNLHIKHQEIADDLNTSRVVISRLLKKLERSGKIKLGRNKIKIIDL
ncbi:MAG: Crp/Fnr family transcriptional regulator [Flavobacteriia bacterium]|nr:MAG: Crp/Fnr family transcriptional regulator [Flavobacteriia bacterium]